MKGEKLELKPYKKKKKKKEKNVKVIEKELHELLILIIYTTIYGRRNRCKMTRQMVFTFFFLMIPVDNLKLVYKTPLKRTFNGLSKWKLIVICIMNFKKDI